MDNVYGIFEDDFDILEIIEFGFPRAIYTRQNHFEMDDLNFYRRFRLHKETVSFLLDMVGPSLELEHDLNAHVSPRNQLLVCLRFFASPGYLIDVADFSGVHVATASRIIARMSESIASLRNKFVKMPDNMQQVQNDFFDIAAFPRVGAAIDCTHVKIQSPGGNDAELFRNRKNYFSINVQAACDSHLKILDIVARWPGGTHDSTIFNNSRLKARFDAGHFPNTLLIGDSGCPLRSYFFTPIHNANTEEKRLYNEAHIRTRNCVERMFGLWKRRFPVLAYGLRLKLQTTLTVIVACAVLHNIALEMNEPIEVAPVDAVNVHELDNLINLGHIPPIPHANGNNGGDIREEFLNNYFRNL